MKKIFYAYLIIFTCLCLSFTQSIVENGILKDSAGQALNSTLNMQFKIFSSSSNTTAVWDSGIITVSVSEGFYSTELGSALNPIDDTIFNNAAAYYLEQTVESEVLTPRKKLYSTPQAIYSSLSDTANYALNALNSNFAISANISITANNLASNKISQFENDRNFITTGDISYLAPRITTIIDNYSITSTDNIILANSQSNTIQLVLPPLTGSSYIQLTIKKIDSSRNSVLIQPQSGDTIDSENSYILTAKSEYVTLLGDGSQWFIVNNN